MSEAERQREDRRLPTVRRPVVPVAILLSIWFLAYWFGGTGFDRTLLRNAYAGDEPWMPLAIFVTHIGDWEALVAFTFFGAGWLILKREWRASLFLIAATLLGRLAVSGQKILLGRARPAENDHLVDVTTLSFPSGHSANSAMVFLLLAIMLMPHGRSRIAAVVGALLIAMAIGLSRSMLGVHWPSDVLGGWSFGLLWVILCLSVARGRPGLVQ